MGIITHPSRIRLGAVALAIAGILFVIYPAVRPFSDETSLQGAAAFASQNWMLAHMLAMIAFTLLPVGFLSLILSLQGRIVERIGYWALIMSLVGVGLTLPFYGGETFGLHAIGQEALKQQNANLMSSAAVVRSGPGLLMFVVGLLLLAIAAILAAFLVWKAGKYFRWSGVPLAVGMALYIPQFFFAQPVRVAHGVLVAFGCLWLAIELWSQRD